MFQKVTIIFSSQNINRTDRNGSGVLAIRM